MSTTPALRSRLWLAVKVGLTALLVWGLARSLDWAGVKRTLVQLDALALAAVVLLTFAAVGVSAVRWARVLRYLDEPVSVWSLFGDTLVGTTYNLLLPTSVGGDVIRSLRCQRRLRDGAHAWASVAFERVMGLVSLALVSAVGLFSAATAATHALLLVSFGLAGALVLGLLVAPQSLAMMARQLRRSGRLTALSLALDKMATAFGGPLARLAPRAETFLWSLAYQVVSLAILWAAGRGWGEPELARAVFLGVPIALVLSIAPVTIGGFGLREGLFVAVLVPFGLSQERAFALSLVWLASNLMAAIAGGVVLLRPSDARPNPDSAS